MLDEISRIKGVLFIEYSREDRNVKVIFDLRQKDNVRQELEKLGIKDPRLDVRMIFDEWEDLGPHSDSVTYNLRCEYGFYIGD